uniref:Putative extracellular protein TR9_087 n=1 Tax=Trebouxia lynnae TaxID=1825957 RepID=A0A7L9QES0_9CHLO|nr:putative extracellular protein TR9_087 [Trebouxia lynnae]
MSHHLLVRLVHCSVEQQAPSVTCSHGSPRGTPCTSLQDKVATVPAGMRLVCASLHAVIFTLQPFKANVVDLFLDLFALPCSSCSAVMAVALGMTARLSLAFLCTGMLLSGCSAVRIGDEAYGTDVGGVFYVFADMAVHVINPSNLSVVKTIEQDQDGNTLSNVGANGGGANISRSWNDAVLAEDPSLNKSYLFVNEGDVYPGPGNQTHSYVTVIDTSTATIIARVSVSPLPVHIYVVNPTREVWTHSDTDGTFDVIAVADIAAGDVTSLNATNVPGLVREGGHGKLLLDTALYPKSYATNVNEHWLNQLNLVDRTRTASFDFSESMPTCTGTHSIVYSNISQHAYVECVDGGIFEWNTVDDTLIHFFANVTGYLTASLGDDWILVSDASSNLVTLLLPQANGVASKVAYSVSVEGNPQHPIFYSNSSDFTTVSVLQEYTIFFPLADDTNIANLATGLDVQAASYSSAPGDCVYDNTTAITSETTGLTLARSGNQVQTPDCGACAPGFEPFDPSYFNGSVSGVRYVTLPNIQSNASIGMLGNTTFISAGAVMPAASESTDANQCSLGDLYRIGKRGGPFIATNADIPTASVYFIDASNPNGPELYGTVNTSTRPAWISWVPLDVPALQTTILGAA